MTDRRTRFGLIAILIFALSLIPALAALAADFATVTGYAAGTAANNNPATWGEDCTKVEEGLGDTYVLTEDYALVVVKAGSEEANAGFVNTEFADASSGQTVFADTNGNGVSDPGGKGGDKTISHIILCPAADEPSTAPSDEPSSEPSIEPSDAPSDTPSDAPSATPNPDSSDAPEVTPPPTDTEIAADITSDPGNLLAVILIVAGLGLLFAIVPKDRRRA